MDIASWLPTIINVGSSLFGGGGSSAPSAPSSSGVDWGSILSGVGQLASRFEAVPGAGATDEDIRKANRYNLIAGLLGGGSQIAGGLMTQQRKAGMLQDVSDILSGKQTTTGQQIAPVFAGTTATPTATPTPTEAPAVQAPQSQVSAIWGLANKYPESSGELFKLGQSVQEAQAKSVQAEQERQAAALTQAGNILSRPGIVNVPPAIAEEIVARTGLPVSGISDVLAKQRQQAEEKTKQESAALEAQVKQRQAAAGLSEARKTTVESLLEPTRKKLEAQAARALNQESTSNLNAELSGIQNRLGIETAALKDLRDAPTIGLTEEQKGQRNALLQNQLGTIGDLTARYDELLTELAKRNEPATTGQPVTPLTGLIQPTPASQAVDTLKALNVPNAEQTVAEYFPQKGDITMAPIEVQGKAPPQVPSIKQRVALFEVPKQTAEKREGTDKADKIFSSKSDITFRDNKRQQESLTKAAFDLTRTTDEKGNPLTPNQILLNQIVGVKNFVRGIDFSVVYQTELEDAISKSSSNLDNVLRELNSWLDNPKPLDANAVNGYLATINGQLALLGEVDARLTNAKEIFRNDYLNNRDRPVEAYMGQLYKLRPNEMVKTVKAKIETLGGGQPRSSQSGIRKFKPGIF